MGIVGRDEMMLAALIVARKGFCRLIVAEHQSGSGSGGAELAFVAKEAGLPGPLRFWAVRLR